MGPFIRFGTPSDSILLEIQLQYHATGGPYHSGETKDGGVVTEDQDEETENGVGLLDFILPILPVIFLARR